MRSDWTKTVERTALWLLVIIVNLTHLSYAAYNIYNTIEHEILQIIYASTLVAVAIVTLTIALRVDFYDK